MWRSKRRSSCKYTGLVSRTFIFSMLFNSFHLKIAFGLKGVKPSAANISFFHYFWPLWCSNDALTKRQGMALTSFRLDFKSAPDRIRRGSDVELMGKLGQRYGAGRSSQGFRVSPTIHRARCLANAPLLNAHCHIHNDTRIHRHWWAYYIVGHLTPR